MGQTASNLVSSRPGRQLLRAAQAGQDQLLASCVDQQPQLLLYASFNHYTALHHAARNGHLSTVKLIVNRLRAHAELLAGEAGLAEQQLLSLGLYRQLRMRVSQLKRSGTSSLSRGEGSGAAAGAAASISSPSRSSAGPSSSGGSSGGGSSGGGGSMSRARCSVRWLHRSSGGALAGAGSAEPLLSAPQLLLCAALNHTTHRGMTALMLACQHGHDDVAAFLMHEGADPLATDCQAGMTCLHHAAREGHAGCIRAVVGAGHVLPARRGAPPAPVASAVMVGGAADGARFVDTLTLTGYSALHYAAYGGHRSAVAALVAAGAARSVYTGNFGLGDEIRCSPGCTALHLAAMAGHSDVVVLLLQAHTEHMNSIIGDGGNGARLAWEGSSRLDPRLARSAHRETPFMLATTYGHRRVAALLDPRTPVTTVMPPPLREGWWSSNSVLGVASLRVLAARALHDALDAQLALLAVEVLAAQAAAPGSAARAEPGAQAATAAATGGGEGVNAAAAAAAGLSAGGVEAEAGRGEAAAAAGGSGAAVACVETGGGQHGLADGWEALDGEECGSSSDSGHSRGRSSSDCGSSSGGGSDSSSSLASSSTHASSASLGSSQTPSSCGGGSCGGASCSGSGDAVSAHITLAAVAPAWSGKCDGAAAGDCVAGEAADGCGDEDDYDDNTCSVCMDAAATLLLRPCSHQLCVSCCRGLLRVSKPPTTCPFCRAILAGFSKACSS